MIKINPLGTLLGTCSIKCHQTEQLCHEFDFYKVTLSQFLLKVDKCDTDAFPFFLFYHTMLTVLVVTTVGPYSLTVSNKTWPSVLLCKSILAAVSYI